MLLYINYRRKIFFLKRRRKLKDLIIIGVLLCWTGDSDCDNKPYIKPEKNNVYVHAITNWKKIDKNTIYMVENEKTKENIRIRYKRIPN